MLCPFMLSAEEPRWYDARGFLAGCGRTEYTVYSVSRVGKKWRGNSRATQMRLSDSSAHQQQLYYILCEVLRFQTDKETAEQEE